MSNKIAEFLLSNFRGREEWIAYQKPHSHFKPLKLESPITPGKFVEAHLTGKTCLGFYLLTERNTVFCSALDFDNHDGTNSEAINQAKQAALQLGQLGFNPLFEISQSGEGGHVWLLFEEEVPAWLVRKFWQTFIDLYVSGPVEQYPRQDSLQGKKLGNLIRYPCFNKSKFAYYSDDSEFDWDFDVTELQATGDDLRRFLDDQGVDIQSPSEAVITQPEAFESAVDGYLPERVKNLIESNSNSVLSLRWMAQAGGMIDGTYSAILMSLATELVKAYVPTDEVRDALNYWCQLRQYTKGIERPDIIEHTIDKAYTMVVDRKEKVVLTGNTFAALTHQFVDSVYENEDVLVPTGIRGIDDSVGGLGFGELGIISGRPSQGKTALSLQWMDNAASLGFPCLLISLEMSARENSRRVVLGLTDPSINWKTEQGNKYLHERIDSHYKNRSPIYFVEGTYHIDRIDEAIDHYCKEYGVKFTVLDYQGLATAGYRDEYSNQTEITKQLKKAARRNDIALLSLVQMKRVEGENPSREPQLSDLRSSGEIEQSADLVIFNRWPYMEDNQKPKHEYISWIKKARNREIKQMKVDLFFDSTKQVIR